LDLAISHRHYDLFELGADWSIWFENMTVKFHTDREGDIASLSLPLEPAVGPIVFHRMPEPTMLKESSSSPSSASIVAAASPFALPWMTPVG
jgi:hypothetical protein